MINFPNEFLSSSPEETENLGGNLVRCLDIGSVIALDGNLGAGKTCFVRGIARALGINENITSPTYTIANVYIGRDFPFYHIDAYRLCGSEDFRNSGGEEFLEGGGICVIEWSELIGASIPKNAIRVKIEITGPQSRKISIWGVEFEPSCH